jgi:hypothetical protein
MLHDLLLQIPGDFTDIVVVVAFLSERQQALNGHERHDEEIKEVAEIFQLD